MAKSDLMFSYAPNFRFCSSQYMTAHSVCLVDDSSQKPIVTFLFPTLPILNPSQSPSVSTTTALWLYCCSANPQHSHFLPQL